MQDILNIDSHCCKQKELSNSDSRKLAQITTLYKRMLLVFVLGVSMGGQLAYASWNQIDAIFPSWSSISVISHPESSADSKSPTLAVGRNRTIHIAWSDITDYNNSRSDADIFYKYFTKFGGGWGAAQIISVESTGASSSPSLAIGPDQAVHIVWVDSTDYNGAGADEDIFYKRYEPGTGWTAAEVVSTESTSNSENPRLVVNDDGVVHVVWIDSTDYNNAGADKDIFYKRYEPSMGWTPAEVVSEYSKYNSGNPSMDTSANGNIHIVWSDQFDIWYRFYVQGPGWSGLQRVPIESTGLHEALSVGIGPDGKLYLVWADNDNFTSPVIPVGSGPDWDIFYKFYEPINNSWSETKLVSIQSDGPSIDPSLAINADSSVHIAWADMGYVSESGSDLDVYYVKYEPGVGWTAPSLLSNESTQDSTRITLALSTDKSIHVAWQDETPYSSSGDDLDIFYKRYAKSPILWLAVIVALMAALPISYYLARRYWWRRAN